MDGKTQAAEPGEEENKAGLTPAEQVSAVGDLGRGSHEQTQPTSGEPAKDLPGNQPPPKGRP
jgi:hypothetical protein